MSSSQVKVFWSKTLSSPQVMRRGWPSTQVMRRWQSPGTGKRGKGQNLAAGDPDGTLAGHENPTTAKKGNFLNQNRRNEGNSTHHRDYICPTIDRASCSRGYVRRKLDQRRRVEGLARHKRICDSLWSIQGCLDRYRIGIHSLELRVGCLKRGKSSLNFQLNWKFKEFYHHGDEFRSQRPSCSCNGCARLPVHQTTIHFRMFQELVCHLCKGKIDGSLLGGRRLGRHKVLGIRLVLS